MSRKKHRDRKADKSQGRQAGQRMFIHLVALGLGISAIAAGAFYLLPGKQNGAQSTAPPAAQESARGAGAKTELNSLKGRWQRPDGGYVLEIRDIEASGKMTTGYFNPRPINVSQAEAVLDGATVKVFIELRDVNYPGATYHLTYDPESDQLWGRYFQPKLQQTFDVFFVRMK